MLKDKLWLDELSKGSEISFGHIYDRYWRELFISAHKVLQDKSLAEDIVQDTFVNLWKNREKATDIQSLRSYLKTAIRNGCIQHIERHFPR
ncbi:sigma factor [Sphingobacterium sp. DR205]|uniref:RNA polymerase sigma factor n=1 Tax=Sphingobacterium sp. DR205 TaxID=2713573 RepID=UPI0013E4EDD0|nr:sigma factor [Sphingobacterium sp. DR205]QIH35955.1 hypothetical protein G6053_25115 [Sphingobacterium sp. DR205]